VSRVVLKQVTKRYGDVAAVRGLDLDIHEGEFLTLLGPSGCGKTTTLRMIAGFILPTSGTVYLGDEDVTRLPPNKRGIGMVFQDYALFPHMTIGENIAFGLTERKVDKAAIGKRVKELLDLVQLASVEDRYPPELSGGQQQRIAVARAVAYSPRVLLMDEPLGALDLKLREAMQAEIRQIQQRLGTTTVYVTHDQTEAMHMSDRIVVMKDGAIEQMGSAEEIYDRPTTRFVAGFIGQINLLEGTLTGRDGAFAVVELNGAKHRIAAPPDASGAVTVGLRPQHLQLCNGRAVDPHLNTLSGRIRGRTFSGNLVHVDVDLDGGQSLTVEASPEAVIGDPGSAVSVAWRPERGTVLTH
jgi:spermidine/putrescine ABC transporter ATP-binding subunit